MDDRRLAACKFPQVGENYPMDTSEYAARAQLLQAIFEASPDIITVSSIPDGTFIEVNSAFSEQTGWAREEALGKTALVLGLWQVPAERERFEGLFRDGSVVQGFVAHLRSKSGETRICQISSARVEAGGKPARVTLIRDITQAAAAIERERKSAFLLERAEEMAKIGSWEFDYITNTVTGSEGALRIYGVSRDNLSVREIEAVPLPEYRPLLDRARKAHIKRGEPYDIEFKIRRPEDGAVLDIHSRALWDGENKRLFGILRDITEEKRAEAVLRSAIAERDILIQELFHRINNTLQVVLSLFMLEADRDDSPAIGSLIQRMRRRVGAIAAVHGSLYTARDISCISLRDFLSRFLEVSREAEVGEPATSVRLDVEDVDLNIEAAVPCGILLSELVDNAIRYARNPGREGDVLVAARRLEDGEIEITVSDTGPGIDVDPDDLPLSWLGLRLVKLLAESQLHGELRFRNVPGLECSLRFRDRRPDSRS